MNPWMLAPEPISGKFRVGDRVHLPFGFSGLIGEVIEDRGNIGYKGRRLYTVKFQVDEWNEIVTEYGEEDLKPVKK